MYLTPHQLSSDAVRLHRSGVEDFIKQMPDKNYYADSTQISHEVDFELFIDFNEDKTFLKCQRGKYRSPKVIESKFLYTMMPMERVAGLQDDLLGTRLTRVTEGGTLDQNGQEQHAFWEFT